MAQLDPPSPAPARLFVVAIEYAGPDVLAGKGGSRRPLLEHAYEVHTGLIPAHRRQQPRVAFPDPGRGWPSTPHLARCGSCTLAVTELVHDIIRELANTTRYRVTLRGLDMAGDLLWLYPTVVA